MHLQSITRRLSAFGLIGVLALILALTGGALVSAQATPDSTPTVAEDSSGVGGATTAVGGDTAAVGGDSGLPTTGTGSSSQSGFGGLMIVLAAAAAVVVAAVSARTFARRNS